MSCRFLIDDTDSRLDRLDRKLLRSSKKSETTTWMPNFLSSAPAPTRPAKVTIGTVENLAGELGRKVNIEELYDLRGEVTQLKGTIEMLTDEIESLKDKRRESVSSFEFVEDNDHVIDIDNE